MSSSNYNLPTEVMERMGLIKWQTASKFALIFDRIEFCCCSWRYDVQDKLIV